MRSLDAASEFVGSESAASELDSAPTSCSISSPVAGELWRLLNFGRRPSARVIAVRAVRVSRVSQVGRVGRVSRVSMPFNGFQCLSMGFYAFQWVSMVCAACSNESVRVQSGPLFERPILTSIRVQCRRMRYEPIGELARLRSARLKSSSPADESCVCFIVCLFVRLMLLLLLNLRSIHKNK